MNCETRYKLVFNNNHMGIFHIDKNGILIDANDALINILETERSKIIGLNTLELPNLIIVEKIKGALKGNTEIYIGDYTSIISGKTVPIRATFSPITTDGVTDGIIVFFQDCTPYIKIDKLSEEVYLTKESLKFKQQFLANMSHEIRNPLTGIIGMTSILSRTELSEQQKEYLSMIKTASNNLKEVIDQVLDYSKIAAGKMSLNSKSYKTRNLEKLILQLYKGISKETIRFSVIIDENIPEYIKIDISKLNQILSNLISNAVKFTEEGEIKVEFKLSSNINNKILIRVTVSDAGIGISEENKEKLFKPFSQFNDGSKDYEGSGLGLSICKQLVMLYGGEMGVDTELGKGSTFWFTFKAEVGEKPKCKSEKNKENPRNIRILLAEDNRIIQKVIELILTANGNDVTSVSDGYELLQKFKPEEFDLILLDINMNKMDGITAMNNLKLKYKDLPPIIALSAISYEGDADDYKRMGFNEFIRKPIEIEDFNAAVNKVL